MSNMNETTMNETMMDLALEQLFNELIEYIPAE